LVNDDVTIRHIRCVKMEDTEVSNWTVELEERLVDLWEENPCLYDVGSKGYSNRDLKRKALDGMGAILQFPGKFNF
jgi:hypothetical protein